MEDLAVQVVQRQVDCYNRRDLGRFLTLFAEDAEVFDGWTGALIARGVVEIRPRYEKRFQDPIHCQFIGRLVLGNVVVDREVISGLPNGSPVQCMAEYTVNIRTEKIVKCVLFWDKPPEASLP
jgi:putative hydrolase of HD superfamily